MNLLFFYALGLGLPLILVATLCGNLPKDGMFWTLLEEKVGNSCWRENFFLHTTNLFSGILLIALGIVLATGYMTYVKASFHRNSTLVQKFEEGVLHWFTSFKRGYATLTSSSD
ncbi:MAG: hypothetical protein CM1200mP16_17110 [Nitrospina sp.]|nr:MAG: hypothetical protein CM1200mP16_17110 [Nitrospina sp.]